MRHPFDGVQEKKETEAPPVGTTRRGALAALGALVAGLFGWRAVASAPGSRGGIGSLPVASAAAAPPRPQPGPTEKLGEASGPSTTAANEEGGRLPRPTEALHEDGRWLTTKAVGEEGARPPRVTEALREGGQWQTTMAFGEEGGGPTTLPLFEEGGRPPVTMAYPEAGGRRRPWEKE